MLSVVMLSAIMLSVMVTFEGRMKVNQMRLNKVTLFIDSVSGLKVL